MSEIKAICSNPRHASRQVSYNAVKIDIINPQVNADSKQESEQKENYCTCPIYDYPKTPIYEVPKKSIYDAKTVPVPPPVIIQQQVVEAVKEPESVIKSIKNTDKSSVAKKPENIAAEKVDVAKPDEVKPNNTDKAPEAKKPENVAAEKVDVAKSEDVKPVIDINKFIQEIANPDYEKQAIAMEATVQLVQLAPDIAIDLLDVKVVDTLLNLVNQSSANLQGPSPRQIEIREKIMKNQDVTEAELAEANKTSPMELAERNKQYAIYTVASLGKLYGSEVKKMTGEQPSMIEIPGASDIVEQIKSNPNPMVRIAGIKAMNHIKAPEYKQDLQAIYTIAANDPDPIVRKTAQTAMERLEK